MSNPVFFLSGLHPQAVSGLAAEVLLLPAGNVDKIAFMTTCCREKDAPLDEAVYDSMYSLFPFSPAEARTVLREMMAMGEAFNKDGLLQELSAQQQGSLLRRSSLSFGESQDIRAFAASGNAEHSTVAEAPQELSAEVVERQSYIAAQKMLLLIYALEENFWETRNIENTLAKAEQSLAAALGEGQIGSLPLQHVEPQSIFANNLSLWRLFFEAAVCFLPDSSCLAVSDACVIDDLRERSLLQDKAESDLNDISAMKGLREAATAPAWEIAGRSAAPSERPWLEKRITILVYQQDNRLGDQT